MNKIIGVYVLMLLTFSIFLPLTNSANAYTLEEAQQGKTFINSIFGKYLDHSDISSPTGVASYGFYRSNGGWKTYVITTREIVGHANINSLEAGYSHPTSFGNGPPQAQHGINLQLNAVVDVQTTSGDQVYWVQNTNRFDTLNKVVNAPRDLVFNWSGKNTPVVESGGKGVVKPCVTDCSESDYSYGNAEQPYSLPLNITNAIYVEPVTGKGVKVYFYNSQFGGWFDSLLIPVQNIISADLVVKPSIASNGIPYDAEYIWTGYCCGYETSVLQMDSFLGLYYMGGDDNLHPIPSLYTFGSETAETASNLQVTLSDHGPQVQVGIHDNSFLGEIIHKERTLPSILPVESTTVLATGTGISIPAWIKNNAKWWSDGTIDDSTFASGIQYLIKQGIIEVPATQTSSTTSQVIPSWVKNNAKWWSEGQMSDDEFVKAIQYLVSSGIIQVNS